MSLTQLSDQYITERFNNAHYTLIHKIGEGGFGKVFKAKNNNTGQFVAIKFLALEPHLEEQKKQRYIERFKRETALSSKLEHPHIVRLLDKGQIDDDLLFGVFEYIEGISLRQHLTQEGALNAIEATDVMLQVLDALIHAHGKGIIHRDIKPANIMLAKSGAKTYAKILDFGIGTLVSEHRQPDFNTLTLTQETLGTPSYSAPEQLRGEPATTQTDLYVWGLVFLECLTGQPAVSGSSIASIYHKQLSDVNVSLPAPLLGHPLAALFRRVLKKNAIERVITTQESYNELNSINVANLVGILTKGGAQHGFDDDTVILRKDAQENNNPHHTLLTERKQITVLALKISITEVNDKTKDLDVIDTLSKAQLNQCVDIATRFNAYHVGTLGDMLLFYFGFPVASDNDTRLSARTALEIMSEMSKRDALMQEVHGISFNIHIGLHTGVFVTYANTIPEGHITNTAMELARCAQAKQILCSGDSRAILEPYSEFEGTKLPNLQQPGSPATVYSLKGERQVEAFGFMRGTRNNHELIGREKELDKTLSVVKQAENTHIAHIHGEAGIGKSRLLQEVRSHAAHYQHLVAQCLPEHQNNALYPVLTLIRYLFNTPQLSSNAAIDLFSELLSQQDENINVEHALPILFIWLNIPLPEDMQTSTLAPDQQKSVLFSCLTALLLNQQYSISDNKLYIIEDIHWADTTTIEFIEHFASQLTGGHVLISTSRQQVPSALKDLTLMEVNLQKLTEQATKDFIIKLFDNQPVANNVLDVLISRTDGIPLFIEELVGMLKQKALVDVIAGEINFISPDKLDQVPSSLRESLQQKLDSLVHAKETAQLAATIGREFEYDLLVAASSLSENQIQNDLNELVANDLIVQQRRVNNDSYIFKHALVRDAAYESMKKSIKIKFHKLIANALVQNFSSFVTENPFIVANHFAKGLMYPEAVKFSLKAGELAILQSKESFALQYANDAKIWNENLIESYEKDENKLAIYSLTIPALMVCEGYGALSFNEIAEQSNIIFEKYDDINKSNNHKNYEYNILWSIFLFHNNRSKRDLPYELALKMYNKAKKNQNSEQEIFAQSVVAFCDWTDGRYHDARSSFENVIQKYEDSNYNGSEFATKFGLDPKSWSLAILSLIYWEIGLTKRAECAITDSISYAKEINHFGNLSYSTTCNSILAFEKVDKQSVNLISQYQSELELTYGKPYISSFMWVVEDWANGKYEYSTTFLDSYWSAGLKLWVPMSEIMLAENLLDKNLSSVAFERLKKIFNWVDNGGEQSYISKLYIIHAKLLHNLNNSLISENNRAEIKKSYLTAIDYAENQKIPLQILKSTLAYLEYLKDINNTKECLIIMEKLKVIVDKMPKEHHSIYLDKAQILITQYI
jgi:TOMM system kinase/cyclase fusion protein